MKFLGTLAIMVWAIVGLVLASCGGWSAWSSVSKGAYLLALAQVPLLLIGTGIFVSATRYLATISLAPPEYAGNPSPRWLWVSATAIQGFWLVAALSYGLLGLWRALIADQAGVVLSFGLALALTMSSIVSGLVSTYRPMSPTARVVSYTVAFGHFTVLMLGMTLFRPYPHFPDYAPTVAYATLASCLLLTGGHWYYWTRYLARAAQSK